MNFREALVIHSTSHFRKPIVQASDESHDACTNHDVVEVSDDEIRASKGVIESDRCQVHACYAADNK